MWITCVIHQNTTHVLYVYHTCNTHVAHLVVNTWSGNDVMRVCTFIVSIQSNCYYHLKKYTCYVLYLIILSTTWHWHYNFCSIWDMLEKSSKLDTTIITRYTMVAGISHDIAFGMCYVLCFLVMWYAFWPFCMLFQNHRELTFRTFKG